jgi:hypothetical protein
MARTAARGRFHAAVVVLLLLPSHGAAQVPHEDCRVATLLSQFARIYGTADLPVIETSKDEICAAPMSNKSLRWPNKRPMKSAGGTWSYPNGMPARSAGGTWTYPNREQAKSTGGSWLYPDGNVARSASGTWILPHRETASLDDLRSWARQRVSAAEYKRLADAIGAAQSDDEVIVVVELAWLAR